MGFLWSIVVRIGTAHIAGAVLLRAGLTAGPQPPS